MVNLPLQGDEKVLGQGDGNVPPKGDENIPVQSDVNLPLQGDKKVLARGDRNVPPKGDENVPVHSDSSNSDGKTNTDADAGSQTSITGSSDSTVEEGDEFSEDLG